MTLAAMLTFDLLTCMQFIWALVDRSMEHNLFYKEDFSQTAVQWKGEKAQEKLICITKLAGGGEIVAICIAM